MSAQSPGFARLPEGMQEILGAARRFLTRLDIPERKKLVFESTLAIRCGDMDAMGHLKADYFWRGTRPSR